MSLTVGLDFGTTNSAISITDKLSKENYYTSSEKSVLFFQDTNQNIYSVGNNAINDYVKSDMTGRLLKSVKTLLKQKDFQHTYIFGKKITPEELCSYIISYLKKEAETYTKKEINEVVLGRPASFSNDPEIDKIAENRLLKAAEIAGFKDIKLVFEPIAAAYTYEKSIEKSELVLVADIGGGTSDFTIMNLHSDKYKRKNRNEDIVASGGLYIGGDLFDSQTMWHKITPLLGRGVKYKSYNKELVVPSSLHWELRNWEKSFLLKDSKIRRNYQTYYVFSGKDKRIKDLFSLIDNDLTYSLFQEIENSKITLSNSETSLISYNKLDININEILLQEEFSSFIKKETEAIEEYVINLIKSSNLSIEDIDTVFMTGGSSSVYSIQQVFVNIFGKDKIRSGDNFNSVSYGLSLYE